MNITLNDVWNGTIKGIPTQEPSRERLNKIMEQWVSFKVWCLEKKKSPNHGASVREYCMKNKKEMIS